LVPNRLRVEIEIAQSTTGEQALVIEHCSIDATHDEWMLIYSDYSTRMVLEEQRNLIQEPLLTSFGIESLLDRTVKYGLRVASSKYTRARRETCLSRVVFPFPVGPATKMTDCHFDRYAFKMWPRALIQYVAAINFLQKLANSLNSPTRQTTECSSTSGDASETDRPQRCFDQ
jgi:hypothetical protein